MFELILASTLFIVSHLVFIHAPMRMQLEQKVGARLFQLLYSLLSVALLIWLGFAFAKAPYVALWPYSVVATWLPVVLMPFACILLMAGIVSPNPLSLSIKASRFKPAHPGIVTVTRHPIMWAFILWAASHLPANGDLAGLLLFGLMLLLSLSGCKTIDYNKKKRLGESQWRELSANTSIIPFAAIISGKTRFDWRSIGFIRLLGGLHVYGIFAYFHLDIIGVAPPIMAFFP